MKRQQQQLDRADPNVRQFVRECGLSESAVSIRLIGTSQPDVETQIKRLESTFGQLIMMTAPRQSGRGEEWIAYGTIIG